METAKRLIEEIKKEKNIDVSRNITMSGNTIKLKNNKTFDFKTIFVIGVCKPDISKLMQVGTSKTNIYVKGKYCEILINYYVIYNEKDDYFMLHSIA